MRTFSQSWRVLPLMRSIGMAKACASSESNNTRIFDAAVFADVLGLLGPFVEDVLAPVWSVGMPNTGPGG